MAVRRQGKSLATVDARCRWIALRWFLLPLPEMPPEPRRLAERYWTEVQRLQSLPMMDLERCDVLLGALDDMESGLRYKVEQYLEGDGQ